MANQILPRFRDVTKVNPADIIYLKGKENVDGSLRIVPDTTHDGTHFELELRTHGVWNLTSLDVSGETALSIGEGLDIGAAGPHLMSKDSVTNTQFLHGRTAFSDSVGTAEAAETPILTPKVIRSILQPDDSGEKLGTTITWSETLAESRVVTKIYLNVSTPATNNVTLNLRAGSADGNLIFTHRLGASELTGGEVGIELHGWVNQETIGASVYFEIIVDSNGTIGIASDLSSIIPWYAYDYFIETHSIIAPINVTADSMIFDDVTERHVLTTEGNMIVKLPNIEV
jgi:hypothetical protein